MESLGCRSTQRNWVA